jgi:hypothetical protein
MRKRQTNHAPIALLSGLHLLRADTDSNRSQCTDCLPRSPSFSRSLDCTKWYCTPPSPLRLRKKRPKKNGLASASPAVSPDDGPTARASVDAKKNRRQRQQKSMCSVHHIAQPSFCGECKQNMPIILLLRICVCCSHVGRFDCIRFNDGRRVGPLRFSVPFLPSLLSCPPFSRSPFHTVWHLHPNLKTRIHKTQVKIFHRRAALAENS